MNLKYDHGDKTLRHDLRSLVENLVDIVSKNGSLLLNVAVRGDGSVPEDQREVLDNLGDWLRRYGTAIYETRPWRIYGTGGDLQGGHFNERKRDSESWGPDVVRFTRSQDNRRLYVFVFGVSRAQEVVIQALAPTAGHMRGRIHRVTHVGHDRPLEWSLHDDGLHVSLPVITESPHCAVLVVDTDGLDHTQYP